jgi:hypothetical protein
MSAPDSPYEKKEVDLSPEAEETPVVLTLEERVAQLEAIFENGFNMLARGIHENELRNEQRTRATEAELGKTLTIMNYSTIQALVTQKEILGLLTEKNVLDKAEAEGRINGALVQAVKAQEAAMQKAIEEQTAKLAQP